MIKFYEMTNYGLQREGGVACNDDGIDVLIDNLNQVMLTPQCHGDSGHEGLSPRVDYCGH